MKRAQPIHVGSVDCGEFSFGSMIFRQVESELWVGDTEQTRSVVINVHDIGTTKLGGRFGMFIVNATSDHIQHVS